MTEPIRYIDRTRAYYRALGYGAAYEWAQNDSAPFAPAPDLAAATVAVVTTAAPFRPEAGDQGPGAPYNGQAKFYEVYALPSDPVPDLRISHVAIDRDHTTAEDPGSYLPLAALKRAEEAGRIGQAAPLVFGLPTNRSQRHTVDVDCPELVGRLTSAGIDAVIFVPNCPVCHQSCALAARAVEEAGIPTVIMGCALDIVKRAGVPRFLFSDFPLGNAAGRPNDVPSQDQTLAMALDLLETAQGPRATHWSPLVWPGPPDWREDYSNPARLSADEIARRRAEFDKGKAAAKARRTETL
ncbi:glycine reductase [Aestuariivita boseongensis]|uniref:glycine reductase n=1 Tax=Aestuariivita boseongensis TaxID=1470562 RepID=UPI0006826F89|nr:glycine reductase [Aestuariivita boseongensis]